jgi:hypothetical protein
VAGKLWRADRPDNGSVTEAVVFLRTRTNYTPSVADDLTFATAIADAAADFVRHRAVTA